MQRLPAELHGLIFAECIPDDPYLQPKSSQAPLLLVRVCRRWRAVALRTPQLWRSLDAVQDLGIVGLGTVPRGRINFYRSWLSRSGNLPLSLGVSFSEHPSLRHEWLQAVRCYRARFERLRIVDGAGIDVNLLLDGTRMLRHLVIQARSQEGDLTAVQPQPCLQTLVLDLLHASQTTFLRAEWDNLTHLAVRLPDHVSYEVDDFFSLLDRCPKLERLIVGPVAASSLRQSSRSHPNLRELSVIFDGSEAQESHLSTLSLPGLLFLGVLCRLEGDLEDALLSSEELGSFPLDGPAGSSEQEPPSAVGLPERTCRLQVEGGDQCFAMFDLCWANITRLDIKVGGSTGVLGTVLVLCPNLQALSLYGRHCTPRCTSLAAPFSHPVLSLLSITVSADFGNFFFAATLPGLREFSILAVSYGKPEDIRAFLVRSGCPLQVLRAKAKGSRVWTAEEQAELTELIPTLTRLELNT